MGLLRSARFPAVLLLVAAALGLVLANSPAGPLLDSISDAHLGIPGTAVDLSVSHWISDGLLALFFFAVAVELRHELTEGELRTPRRALPPAIAAAGGVLVPVGIYLLVTAGSGVEFGWPVPTATDVAFALGVLAVFGRGLPASLRIFLLALAILDDIIGIVFIAVLFTDGLDPWWLLGALALAAVFGLLSRLDTEGGRRVAWVCALVVLALGVWVCVLASGVHATIAGVVIGLAMDQHRATRTRHALEPAINGVVLPLFAFSAALVAIPQVAVEDLSPAFWGVLIALPVGKLVGISVAGWVAQRLLHVGDGPPLRFADLLAAGALGGIGFTVSLLLGELAFAGDRDVASEVTLAVLTGSVIAMILAGFFVSHTARGYRARARVAQAEATEGPS